MIRSMQAVCLTLSLVATSAPAQFLDGADDPAFQSAMGLALNSDDASAVAALRDLAEAGNVAALVALPFALQWIPPQGNLAEKNAQRKVGGTPAHEAAAEAHGATALWNTGRVDVGTDLVSRAVGLVALGEPEKAAWLLSSWVNQTGGSGDLPETLFSPETPAWIGALALTFRIGLGPASVEDQALLAALLDNNNPAAWMALIFLTDRLGRDAPSLGDPLRRAGIVAETASVRQAVAQALIAVSPPSWREMPVLAEAAALARETLIGRAEFGPVAGLCRAHCRDSAPMCEAAVLAYPGLPFGHFEAAQPFVSILAPDHFYASDRGIVALIPMRKDPVAAADRVTAESLDACYANLLQRRDSLSFGP
jgi:hypothetical protein